MATVLTGFMFLALIAAVQGHGWNPDRSRPVPSDSDMDDCCRGPTGCCREGYRCEPNYRTCVRVSVVPRPSGSTKVRIVPVVSRRNQGTLASGATSIGGCGGGGHYCWDHHRCCHISQSGAHLPTSLHHTTSCCSQGSQRQCPRIRGCHSNLGMNSHSGIYNSPGIYSQSGTYNSPGVYGQSGIYSQRGSYNQPSVYSQSSYRSQQTYNNPSTYDRDREHQSITHRRTVYYNRAVALPTPPIAAFVLSFMSVSTFRS